jgi:hypothetical protein
VEGRRLAKARRPRQPLSVGAQGRLVAGRRGLGPVAADVGDDAAPAFGLPRLADVAAVEDQQMMGLAPVRSRRRGVEPALDLEDVLAGREAGSVADPEDVGVDREGLGPERAVHDDVGGLAPDPGQGLERLEIGRHLAAVALDQRLRQGDDVLRLGVEQADRPDVPLQPFLAQLDHRRRRRHRLEQSAGGEVDARVGGLGGQDHGDEQGIVVDEIELGLRVRRAVVQPPVEFCDFGAGHLSPSTSAIV